MSLVLRGTLPCLQQATQGLWTARGAPGPISLVVLRHYYRHRSEVWGPHSVPTLCALRTPPESLCLCTCLHACTCVHARVHMSVYVYACLYVCATAHSSGG